MSTATKIEVRSCPGGRVRLGFDLADERPLHVLLDVQHALTLCSTMITACTEAILRPQKRQGRPTGRKRKAPRHARAKKP